MPKGGGRRGGISKGAMRRAVRRADEDERRAKKWQQRQGSQGQSQGGSTRSWGYGQSSVDGQPAKTAQTGSRIEAKWGGSPQPDQGDAGHIVANDGYNANYVREPDGYVVADDAQDNPYEGYHRRS